jgi:HD-GYP domain-containing protein (c-di-GMP phosphodiesterase class II)
MDMNAIPVSELRENSYFNAPLYLEDGYILLSPDTEITAELIERLKRWGYQQVLTEGSAVEAPAYSQSGATDTKTSVLELDIKEKQQIEEARKLYYSLANFTVETFKRYREENKLSIPHLSEQMKQLIEKLKSSRDAVLRYPEFSFPSENYLYTHSVNSTILALAIGDLMKLPPHRLIELGIAAVLHDIGMLKLPDAIYLKSSALSEKELQMVQAHTTLGYRILKGFSVSEEIALGAYEHHERLDGSGYPRALVGDKASLYSRIIAVVCSYDAMSSKRLYKSQKDMHTALMELVKQRNRKYDERVVRSLIVCLSVFPLGSLVLLSDEAIGRVVKTNPENPRFPFVQILFDRGGNRITENPLVKTAEGGGISIQRGLSAQEAEGLNI